MRWRRRFGRSGCGRWRLRSRRLISSDLAGRVPPVGALRSRAVLRGAFRLGRSSLVGPLSTRQGRLRRRGRLRWHWWRRPRPPGPGCGRCWLLERLRHGLRFAGRLQRPQRLQWRGLRLWSCGLRLELLR
eukprot:scaffold98315_cov64-Phaeocystis_antarctica.AAC.5